MSPATAVGRSAAKVVHMTSAHSSRDTRIFAKECRSLAAAGYEVVLLAQSDRAEEVVDGVTIRGVPRPGSRWQRMMGTTRRLLRRALGEQADLYHFHDPELVPVGLCLKAAGRMVVWDVHEDLPRQVLAKDWIPRVLRGIVSATARLGEGLVVRGFDAIVAATPAIGERYDGRRVVVVNNYPRLADLAPAASEPSEPGAPAAVTEERDSASRQIVYTGSITRIRGIFEMVEAVHRAADDTGVRLAMAGQFSPPELRNEVVQRPGWERVDFYGWLSHEEVFGLLHHARAGVVLFQPAPNHMEAKPNKLFEYMAAGLPVVASDFPLWRELIVEEVGCGWVVDPTCPGQIADALRWIFRHPLEAREMGRRGREAVRNKYHWDSEEEKLIRLYKELGVTT